MPTDDASADIARLCVLLDEAVAVLSPHGETQWSTWLSTCARELRAQDAHGLDRLLSGFGGMGSFNDLLVLRVNGHIVDQAHEDAVNRRLDELRLDIWTDATGLRHKLRPTE
jgi:hypothetical protein